MTKDDEVKSEMIALLMAALKYFSDKMPEEDKKSMLWDFNAATKEEKNAFYGGIQQAMGYINATMDSPVFPSTMFNADYTKGVN